MPSRRSLLASGAVAAAALAGCSALSDPEGSSAEVRPSLDVRPADGEAIARATTERTSCPKGDIDLRATAVERADGRLQCWCQVQVYPGAEECKSDWRHRGVDVTHAWADLGTERLVTDTATNVAYTDAPSADARLQNTGNTGAGEWRVRLTDGRDDFGEYAFRSDASVEGAAPAAGDELVTVSVAVPLSQPGLLGGDAETVTRSVTLVYGERTRS